MTEITPTILEYSIESVRLRAHQVQGLVKRVQIDIVDGVFAKPPTWPFAGDDGSFKRMSSEEEGLPGWEKLDFEVDMMVHNPERYLEEWVNAGVACVIIHRASTDDAALARIHTLVSARDVSLAIAVRPSESLEFLNEWVEKIAFLQVMGNDQVGVRGIPLTESALGKIQDIRRTYPELIIGVDIGINRDTAPRLVKAGASKLAIGSAIFKSEDIKEAVEYFQSL